MQSAEGSGVRFSFSVGIEFAVVLVALICLLFGGGTVVFADPIATTSPYKIGYYCSPQTASYVENGYYTFDLNAACFYDATSLPKHVRFGLLLRGTIGSSTVVNGHSLGLADLSGQLHDYPHNAKQGEPLFAVVYAVHHDSDLQAFNNFFFTGSSPPPHYDFGFLNWKWGTSTSVCTQDCLSNVLFIPGMEASRLYVKNPDGSETQAWEPGILSFQADAKKLYLNSDGTSINDVYTKSNGTIDTTAGGDIYSSFLQLLASLKANGTYNDYAIFPYDWRMSPLDVVEKGTPYDDGTHYPESLVEELASSSKSGKVTIVAHSNGGLVTKALMLKLERDGKADLVDKILFVDVPQLGTPKTVAAMLHGDGESIGWPYFDGLVISQANARALGEYMPDGYDLLPSPAYFARVATPVVDLSQARDLRAASDVSNFITDSASLAQFLTTGREKPVYLDTETPDLLSLGLLADATALHADLDIWTPPEGVKVIQIAGWGLDTPSGIIYSEYPHLECSTLGCVTATSTRHTVSFTEDGDDTVVTPSEVAMTDWPMYYVNIKKYNDAFKTKFSHANITEMPPVQDFISLFISSSSPTTVAPYVTTEQPQAESSGNELRLRVLSPVTFDAYDGAGRHTGLAPNPNPQSDLEYVEEQIPGSYYQRYGEGQYIGLPAGGAYTIVMHGTDTGTFTFEETLVSGGTSGDTISYRDIPVTPSTTATTTISASTSQLTLSLDYDGDGAPDATLASGAASDDPLAYIGLMRDSIAAMDIGSNVKKHVDDTLDSIERDIGNIHKGTQEDTSHRLDNDEKYLQDSMGKNKHTNDNHLSPGQAGAIITMLEKLRSLIIDNV